MKQDNKWKKFNKMTNYQNHKNKIMKKDNNLDIIEKDRYKDKIEWKKSVPKEKNKLRNNKGI